MSIENISLLSNQSNRKDKITLYEEYRLIEKNDSEVNGAWKGVHLLLFFLAFVFGSFCTFCFHVLIYLFDEKCVLFPKLISLKDIRKNVMANKLFFDYVSEDMDTLPVDFVSTRWVEKSTCYLPTYVPLLSGICGLIWTTMFLMCTSGSRALTGLQRPWRILPIVFVFSVSMSVLCVYTSSITQAGLTELCTKLGEITGSNTCTYTINVATLAYERRIRGVYQATRLTIMSAWLHTLCWIGAAVTALARVILIVDFRLVKVRAELQGNIERMLERHEKHIRTDEFSSRDDYNSPRQHSEHSMKVHFMNKGFSTEPTEEKPVSHEEPETFYYIAKEDENSSDLALDPQEFQKLALKKAPHDAKRRRILVDIIHGATDKVTTETKAKTNLLKQQARRQGEPTKSLANSNDTESVLEYEDAIELAKRLNQQLNEKVAAINSSAISDTITLKKPDLNTRKTSLKNTGVQTDKSKRVSLSETVQISSPTLSETSISINTLKPAKSYEDILAESHISLTTNAKEVLPENDPENKNSLKDNTPTKSNQIASGVRQSSIDMVKSILDETLFVVAPLEELKKTAEHKTQAEMNVEEAEHTRTILKNVPPKSGQSASALTITESVTSIALSENLSTILHLDVDDALTTEADILTVKEITPTPSIATIVPQHTITALKSFVLAIFDKEKTSATQEEQQRVEEHKTEEAKDDEAAGPSRIVDGQDSPELEKPANNEKPKKTNVKEKQD